MDHFWAAPPVTRTLTALTFAQSALVYGGILSGYRIAFLPDHVFKLLPEIWRLGTSFLLTGPQMSFLFDLYFMYTYGSALESGSPRFNSPGDFLTYVIFVAAVILAWWEYLEIAGVIKISSRWCVIFTSALILAFAYTFAQENKGKKVTFFVVQIPIEYLPWAILGLTMVIGGWPLALRDSMGIVAAHLYDFLTYIYPTFGGGRNYITTPGFVRRFFSTGTPQQAYRSYGTAYRSGGQSSESSTSGGWTSSFQSSWGGRGPGRRLGSG